MSQLAWMAAPDGARTWCNRRWLEYTGQSMHQALGMGWFETYDPDLAAAALDSQRASFARSEPWEHLVRLRRHDGEYRWFLARATPVHDADGRVLYWLGTSTDITDRLRLEEALQESASRLRRALEIENIGVIFFDDKHCVTSVNHAFVEMSGYAETDTSGRTLWRDFTATRGAEPAMRRAKEFDATGRVAPAEEEFVRPDGSRWWGLVAAKRIGPNEGVKFVVDISARKRAEEALERQIGLEQQARQSAEFEAAIREQLLGIVAHDLRNPLHTIVMAAHILTDLPLAEGDRIGPTQVIRRSAARMERLIADLLDASRMKSGTFSIRKGEVQAEEICLDVTESFVPQARELGIRLESHVEPDLPAFEGDADRLIQLLANLVGNALKFTARGGKVAISAGAGAGSGTITFSVSDTGSGIAQENLSAVFDRFWQAHPGGAGAGLGLAIAKGIAEAHGGSIGVTSRIGEGTTFAVTLPMGRAGSARPPAVERQRSAHPVKRDPGTAPGAAEQRL
jgi:PAS domain S-box-containing protein